MPVGGVAAESAVAPGEASEGGKGEGVSPEEAARKEAKRLAFTEDRARIQVQWRPLFVPVCAWRIHRHYNTGHRH